MDTKLYVGKVLSVTFPLFLKVKKPKQNWLAVSPDNATTVVIEVDPLPGAAEGFAELVRDPFFAKAVGVKIDREGHFKLDNGLEGYERVFRLIDVLGHVYTYGWGIDGKLSDHILNIQITTIERDWHGGSIWEALLKSTQVVS